MPNQLGIDQFDLEDALGAKKNHLCSADLDDFIENNHLDLSWNGVLNPRDAFGSTMILTMCTTRRVPGSCCAI